jgi:hypothetical protein
MSDGSPLLMLYIYDWFINSYSTVCHSLDDRLKFYVNRCQATIIILNSLQFEQYLLPAQFISKTAVNTGADLQL